MKCSYLQHSLLAKCVFANCPNEARVWRAISTHCTMCIAECILSPFLYLKYRVLHVWKMLEFNLYDWEMFDLEKIIIVRSDSRICVLRLFLCLYYRLWILWCKKTFEMFYSLRSGGKKWHLHANLLGLDYSFRFG